MAEITINGVKYTNVPNKKAGTKFAASLTQSNIGASQAVQDYVNSSYFYPLVNAIDINWNGVEVDENSYINSTSDLITYIATKGSNVDLTSYATKNYVDQKIEDVVGGAPDTLDTLKELADALANDATLAYVTEALDGKADKSSLDDYATVAYVTTELDKKADLNDIPSAPDLIPYVTYTQANSYYVAKEDMPVIPDMSSYVTTNTDQTISGGKTFTNWLYIKKNESCIRFSNASNQTLGDIYVTTNYNNIGSNVWAMTIHSMNYSYFLFDQNNYDLIVPKGNVVNNANIISNNKHFYMPLVFKDNSNNIIRANNAGIVDLSSIIPDMTNYATTSDVSSAFGSLQDIVEHDYATVSYVTTELENKADASDIPDMTNYVDVTSYNALYTEVQRLAYLISYYHPSSPDPGPGSQFEGYWTLNGMRTDIISVSTSDPIMTLSFVSNPTIASGIGTWTFSDMPSVGVTINSSTGEMTITPSMMSEGSVYSGVGYLYQNGDTSASFNITINVTSGSSKQSAMGQWLNSSSMVENSKTVAAGDTTSYVFTFSGTPSDSWSFNYMGDEVSGLSIDTMTGTITIDMTNTTESTIRHMNVNANRQEDSTYYYGSAMFTVTVLPNGTNPGFYYDQSSVNISNTVGVMTPMLYDSISSRRGYVSSDSAIATVSNDGSINYVSDGTCKVTATAYDSSDNVLATASLDVTCTAASKSPATGYFVDGNNNQINTPLAWSDEGGELDGMSATLVSEPASGWTGPVVSYSSDGYLNPNAYTISGNTITFGNIQSPPNVSTFTWSYVGDSLYDMGSVELKVVGLQYEADTQFFPDCGNSTTIQIPAETDVFYFNLINRTGIDQHICPISFSFDNQNITVTSGPDYSFYITNASTGTYQSATITATITDGNDTHTTSFDIEFLQSQPAQEYTNVSVNYEVPGTQATNLPQGTFDTNPFEVGSVGMGNTLIATVEFSGPEYDMNNFNTDFVLTRDTSYAGNYSTVYMPQHPNSTISNTYNNGVNTITFQLSIYNSGQSETSGTNRDVLTFTHNGYTYLTDGIKTYVMSGAT